ncbi:hypothetical protein [Klebsiella pneumoniae]|uniref:hypothetical protein n=1 Tax=Klebsiella pneumoniae TaxID=573 RepID=UPI0022F3F172|nr:hypothetical protein [Klebsiella pneumoniae]WBX45434.1 hypothetical protein MWR71_30300 [Klebsiella pneumoniae]
MKTTVLDNTPIRWFYRAASQESAQWAAGQTGRSGWTWSAAASREAGNVEHISGDSFIRRRRGRCLT